MTAASALTTHRVVLSAPDDFADWRSRARALLAAGIPPEQLVWQVADAAAGDLFGQTEQASVSMAPAMQVPRELIGLMRLALMHSAPERFALAYRLLWRLRTTPLLHRDASDPDMIVLYRLARAVRRDMHKMHAFVRFRKTGEANGREQFAAWFEPDHHITRAVAGFFRDRFTGMDWLIVTPEASISWDGATLREGPGGMRADVPPTDAVEAEWRAYYSSIFNPARLKLNAMRREMPVRYWRNLPEAALISPLVQQAAGRVQAMVKVKPDEPDLFDMPSAQQADERHFDSLTELYQALRSEDEPPSTGFSERLVTGEGPDHASLMLVGEQPGDREDELERPFVGPAGQLLDRCLEQAGLSRDALFLTNAVKRFKFTPRGKRRLHQTPTAGDIAHYRWWLAEEIRLVAPRIVISLGATALQALTGRKVALGSVRGTPMPWNDRTLIPTVHPSYLLRLPDEQARMIEREKFVRDLRRAVSP